MVEIHVILGAVQSTGLTVSGGRRVEGVVGWNPLGGGYKGAMR